MSIQYTVTCACGKKYPVEVSQAGASLTCSCGKTIPVPSMLRLKKLPVWQEDEVPASVTEEQEEPQNVDKRRPPLSASRLGLLFLGLILTVGSAYMLYRHVTSPPQLTHVFYKQTAFADGDKIIRRNSSPITEEDYNFFFLHDPTSNQSYLVDDQLIDFMTPTPAYMYFNVLKNGLELSDNFKDNYDDLANLYRIWTWAWSILLLGSISLVLLAWLLPRRVQTVGAMRGARWTK